MLASVTVNFHNTTAPIHRNPVSGAYAPRGTRHTHHRRNLVLPRDHRTVVQDPADFRHDRTHTPKKRCPSGVGTQCDQYLPLRQCLKLLGSAYQPGNSGCRTGTRSDASQPMRILILVGNRILTTSFNPEIKRLATARTFEIGDPSMNLILASHGAALERVLYLGTRQEKHLFLPPQHSAGYEMVAQFQKNRPVPCKQSVQIKSQLLSKSEIDSRIFQHKPEHHGPCPSPRRFRQTTRHLHFGRPRQFPRRPVRRCGFRAKVLSEHLHNGFRAFLPSRKRKIPIRSAKPIRVDECIEPEREATFACPKIFEERLVRLGLHDPSQTGIASDLIRQFLQCGVGLGSLVACRDQQQILESGHIETRPTDHHHAQNPDAVHRKRVTPLVDIPLLMHRECRKTIRGQQQRIRIACRGNLPLNRTGPPVEYREKRVPDPPVIAVNQSVGFGHKKARQTQQRRDNPPPGPRRASHFLLEFPGQYEQRIVHQKFLRNQLEYLRHGVRIHVHVAIDHFHHVAAYQLLQTQTPRGTLKRIRLAQAIRNYRRRHRTQGLGPEVVTDPP